MKEAREKLLFGNRNEKLNNAFKTFGKTQKDLNQDMQIIKEWLKTQKHFPEVPCDELLTNMIILNKFSIEKLKQHLDMYYSLRSVLSDYFYNKNPKLPHMQVASDLLSYTPMPKLTEEGYRITIIQLTSNKVELYDPFDMTATMGHYVEVRLMKDIMLGEILVIDLKNFTISHVAKVTPMVMKKIFTATEKVYKSIVKQIHFINAPGYVEGTLAFIKQIVSRKLSERIHAHKSYETLTNHVPLKLLPRDFGGPEYSLEELRQLWKEELADNHQRLDELDFLITDETKRPKPLLNDEILGYHGNFKKLDLD